MNTTLIPEDELAAMARSLREKLDTGKGTLDDADTLDRWRKILSRIQLVRNSHKAEECY